MVYSTNFQFKSERNKGEYSKYYHCKSNSKGNKILKI